MQLGDQRASGNVEDRRGIGVGGGLGVGGIVVAVIAYFLGFDPGTAINLGQQVAPQRETREAPKGAPADEMGQFVAKVLGSTEAVWGKVFQQSNSQYRPPTLVLFEGQVRSSCGTGQSAMGPFYCPLDEKLYIDLSFFRDLQDALPRPGVSPQAYVIAHEWATTCRAHRRLANLRRRARAAPSRRQPRVRAQGSCRRTATRACGATMPAP